MRYAIDVPNFGDYGDARVVGELARETEAAGWDGFFIWDHILFDRGLHVPVVDPWVALAAAAMRTERIRLGTMVTPLARRRPWKLARETVSLDHLSGGRLVLGVGLGASPDTDFSVFGDEPDERVRAAQLDEGLDVLSGLVERRAVSLRRDALSHRGDDVPAAAGAAAAHPGVGGGDVAEPRAVPSGGTLGGVAAMRRQMDEHGAPARLTPEDVREIRAHVSQHRETSEPFDITVADQAPGDDAPRAREMVAPYAEAGATWWLELIHGWRGTLDEMRGRIRSGPPM